MTMTIPADCVVFDTETTGFSPVDGDKLVEIGAVRMRDGLPTKEHFHVYINPERSVPDAAVKVHGLTAKFLADKPLFAEVAQEFIDFVGDLPLVAHNAAFDARFINAELGGLGYETYPEERFVDTVKIARKKFPGAQANLDALCRRFKIDLKDRDLHGALIDSVLLAEVCVELSGGRQFTLFAGGSSKSEEDTSQEVERVELKTFVREATNEEQAAHAALVAKLGEQSIWAKIGAEA
jgi:DNA polymerase III subunit epsilon